MKEKITLAFDLETIANKDMIKYLPEIEPNKTLKDPEKIKADIEKKKQKQIDELGVNPHTNIICCACFKDVDSDKKFSLMLNPDTLDEKELLLDIWNIINDYQIFVTFNGMSFDVECLKFHSMLNKIPYTDIKDISQRKYDINSNHIDIRMRLTRNNEYAKGTQDFFSSIILGESIENKGSEIQAFWDSGQYDKISKKCINDVDVLSKLYHRLYGYYF